MRRGGTEEKPRLLDKKMKKNGRLKVEEARCACGRKAQTIDKESGVPVCEVCADEYDGQEAEVHLEPRG